MRTAFFALTLVATLFALLITCPDADAKLQDQTVGVVAANDNGGDIYWGEGGPVIFDGSGNPLPNGGDIFGGGGPVIIFDGGGSPLPSGGNIYWGG